jgi:hypothetical protein
VLFWLRFTEYVTPVLDKKCGLRMETTACQAAGVLGGSLSRSPAAGFGVLGPSSSEAAGTGELGGRAHGGSEDEKLDAEQPRWMSFVPPFCVGVLAAAAIVFLIEATDAHAHCGDFYESGWCANTTNADTVAGQSHIGLFAGKAVCQGKLAAGLERASATGEQLSTSHFGASVCLLQLNESDTAQWECAVDAVFVESAKRSCLC